MAFDLLQVLPPFYMYHVRPLEFFSSLLLTTAYESNEKYKNNAENNQKRTEIIRTLRKKEKNCRINTFMVYRKVLNTVPTLGGVKSAFHEAK